MRHRFVADRMLGRLARMLRLLGYDTLYSPRATVAELQEIVSQSDRVVLTRGNTERRFGGLSNVYSVKNEDPPEQLRELTQRFKLDTNSGLWTRCTRCNAPIEKMPKSEVGPMVEPKIYQLYDEFFRCSGCGHIYWKGSHVDRIQKNLTSILGEPTN